MALKYKQRSPSWSLEEGSGEGKGSTLEESFESQVLFAQCLLFLGWVYGLWSGKGGSTRLQVYALSAFMASRTSCLLLSVTRDQDTGH